MKKVNKLVSLALALVMCLTLAVPAMATQLDSATVSSLEHFSEYEFIMNSYEASELQTRIVAAGQTELTITEGSNSDIILFDSMGNAVLINGKEIESYIQYENAGSAAIQPRNSAWFNTMTCPYGTPSDYSSFRYSKSHGTLLLEKVLSNYTAAALALILCRLVPGGAEASFLLGIDYLVADILINGLADGTSVALSADYYYHRDGHSVPNFGGVRTVDKVVAHWTGSNGKQTTTVSFNVHDFY